MGAAGRIACIFLPYVLSIGTLVCLIMVGLGTTKPSTPMSNIYFLRADLHNIKLDSSNLDSDLYAISKGLQQTDAAGKLEDFYTIGLWNHCYGDYKNGDYHVTGCSGRKTRYWFDPAAVWGLDEDIDNLYPNSLEKGLSGYRKAVSWLFIAYMVALIASAVQLLVGISAIFSRWGSFVTTICASVSSLFTIAAAVTATALYGILMGGINTGLKPFNIKAALGRDMFVLFWLAVIFAVSGGMFWLLSVCCCSGRSPYNRDNRRRGVTAEKTPYTYERVASPYGGNMGGSAVPLTTMQPAPQRETAYEPYRHENPRY